MATVQLTDNAINGPLHLSSH